MIGVYELDLPEKELVDSHLRGRGRTYNLYGNNLDVESPLNSYTHCT